MHLQTFVCKGANCEMRNNPPTPNKLKIAKKWIFNLNNQNIILLFMLAYQSKNDDEDKNDGDGDKEDQVGRHGLLI